MCVAVLVFGPLENPCVSGELFEFHERVFDFLGPYCGDSTDGFLGDSREKVRCSRAVSLRRKIPLHGGNQLAGLGRICGRRGAKSARVGE